jgi:hypothetical protein
MGWTLADIRQFLQDRDRANTSARGLRIYDKIANDANHLLHMAGDWSFDKTLCRFVFEAAKNAGTVSINADAGAITGVGTAIVAGDVGKFFRFNGEPQQYRCLTRVTDLSATCETYRGASNLSGVAYYLTHDRVALGARFRAFDKADDGTVGRLLLVDLDDIMDQRLHGRSVAGPDLCAVEDAQDNTATTGALPTRYLWVYPSPMSKTVLDLPAYLFPPELTATTDGIAAPREAEMVHRAFCLALLYQEQEKHAEYQAQLTIAQEMATRDLARFRAKKALGQREMWDPEADESIRRKRLLPASGEPAHFA